MNCKECSQPLVELGYDVSSTLVGCGGPKPCGFEHDRNCVNRVAWCAQGHVNRISLRRRCNDQEPERSWALTANRTFDADTKPGCDWQGSDTCFCHEGVKVDAWPNLPVRKRSRG